jgi:serine/threonine protein kinase
VKIDFEFIGPYKIIRVLGQGGMGTVYHGVHTKSGDPVAVKIIAPALAQHQRFRRRFDAEIQTLLKLKHPNIVQLIGSGEEKGMLFYSMEYVDGENLQQQLRREKRIDWRRVIEIGIETSSALKHAHDFGIIHRDLKPANLMIDSQGRVKLTDFGIAKLFGAADSTVEGSILGTADFMSPEQAEGKPVTVRSDLYALGSVCYAALTGRAPFQGKTVPEVLFNVRYSNFTPIAEFVKDVPKELSDLIEELLAKDPSRRPPTGLVVGNRFQSLKMGLASRTQANEGPDASRLKELTSIDIDPDILSDPRIKNDHTVLVADRTHMKEDQLISKKEVTRPELPSRAGPNEKTVAAEIGQGRESIDDLNVDRPSGIDHMGQTNFKEFEEKDRRRVTLSNNEPTEHVGLAQWIPIAILSIALLGCIGAMIWLLRSPSANTLYGEIAEAIASNDEEVWLAVEPTALKFQELYPNDPRMPDVEAALSEIDAIQSVRTLQRKARRGSGDQLSPMQQAFLECIEAQSIDASVAIRKYQAFLTMFAGEADRDKMSKQLVAQAKRSLTMLAQERDARKNEALEELEKQADWAQSNLSPELKRKWFAALIELFEDKVWAEGLVERAKKQLTPEETTK